MRLKSATLQNLYHKEPLTVDEVFNKLMEYKEAIAPYVADTFDFMYRAVKEGKKYPSGRPARRLERYGLLAFIPW